MTNAPGLESVIENENELLESKLPIMSEDYVDIGLGGEEEGNKNQSNELNYTWKRQSIRKFDFTFTDNDYSQPAARNYELDRSQVILNDIIGVGQFGDVHIGMCQLTSFSKPNQNKDSSSQNSDNESTVNETIDSDKTIIHVAVKTCKADADLITAEKFLEEACKFDSRSE